MRFFMPRGSEYRYLALKPARTDTLEMEIRRRLHLALLAEEIKIPFVYTPMQSCVGIAQSRFSAAALDKKWEAFFRRLVHEFVPLEQADGRLIWADDHYAAHLETHILRNKSQIADEMYLNPGVVRALEKVYAYPSSFDSPIKTAVIRSFIERAHRAYAETFSITPRAPFADGVLRVTFVVIEDYGLRGPLFFQRLGALLDFVEQCAHDIDCTVRVDLFTSLAIDQSLPDCWQPFKQRALREACSRPCVRHRPDPSFEELVDSIAFADLSWISEVFYVRDVVRGALILISNPKQILLDMATVYADLRSNRCFLLWDGKNFLRESEALATLLQTARPATGGARNTPIKDRIKQILSLIKPPVKRPVRFNLAASVIDGVGSCCVKIFFLQALADYYHLRYVHIPRTFIDHNYVADPEWERKWEAFFMLGADYPDLAHVFGDARPPIRFYFSLPPLRYFERAQPDSSSLVVATMAKLVDWPLPDAYLREKIARIRKAFHTAHQGDPDRFDQGVLNVAVHIRAVDHHDRAMKVHHRFKKPAADYLIEYVDRARLLHQTIRRLGIAFTMHIYSNAHRQDIEPLLGFGDIQLHLADEEEGFLHCLEMSRADVLLAGASYISYNAALFARLDQVQLLLPYDADLLHFLRCAGNAVQLVEDADCLGNVRLIETLLAPHVQKNAVARAE